jgi:uncharacterized membrane protein YcaP (DUF421 family)
MEVFMNPDVINELARNLLIPETSVIEKIVRPVAVYVFLVFILRIGGRRELAQMNAFDLVVLLTLSNAVQNSIIGKDDSLLGGFIGGAALVLTNVAVVRFMYRHTAIDRRIEGEPVLLVKDGQIVRENLERELITDEELHAIIRRQGVERIDECEEVVLETGGTISVLARRPTPTELARTEIVERLDRIERLLHGAKPAS